MENNKIENGQSLVQQFLSVMEATDAEKVLQLYLETASHDEAKMFFDVDKVFSGTAEGRCQWILDNANIDFENCFAVGICFGGLPEIVSVKETASFQEFILTTFAFYNRINKEFNTQKIGFEIHRTAHILSMMGVFPKEHRHDFVERYLLPLHQLLEEQYEVRLCVGVGMVADQKERLFCSYQTAQYARELYFFDQQPIIEYEKQGKKEEFSLDAFSMCVEDVFHSIIVKSPEALNKIDYAVDLLARIHYGNWQAFLMRLMQLTGDLTSRLHKYKLLKGNFYDMQDILQRKILNSTTMKEAKGYVHANYKDMLPLIYNQGKTSNKMVIEHVKTYIQENFMEEISIEKLAEVACVSPNYFSHMFKNEVGQNYKEYLTHIRMEKAVDLILNTDYPLYKIAETVGYNNTRTFVDAFKQVYNDSPTKYKKKLLEK